MSTATATDDRLRKPKRFSAAELDKCDVRIECRTGGRIHLSCTACGTAWSPNLVAGGHLPRGYWKCPNGCNRAAV
jgi:hypothetical protein